MSRLIDADALIEVIKESRPLNWTDSESEIQEDADYNHFIEMVNAQPTAYSIEKVVAELEEVGNQRLEDAFGGREEWEAIAYRQGTRKNWGNGRMTEQEAIKALEFDMEMILFDPYEGKKRTPEQVKAINEANYLCYLADEMAIKALEKQIAKKPLGEYTQCKCSVCGRRVRSGRGSSSFVRDNFCQRCGQAIDWE